MLGGLLAGLLGPGEVLFAVLGLTIAATLWPLAGWPGRLLAIAGAGGWSVLLLGWRNAIPVAALVVFARWFCIPAVPAEPVAALPAPDLHDHDQDQDVAGTDTVPGPTGDPDDPAATAAAAAATVVLPAVLTTPDPDQDARVHDKLARWDQIVAAAGLPGTHLEDIAVDAYGWSAGWLLRPGQFLKHAQEVRAALESALDVRPRAVRVEEDHALARRVRLRVVERDPFAQPIDFPGPTMGTITRPMLLGPYEDGLPCTVALSQQHVFIVGATGSGKSVLLNVALSELAAAGDVVCWGIDFKGGAELGPWQHCLGRIATTPAQAEQLLEAAVAVLEARAARGQRHWPTSPRWPELKILVDEHAELVRHSKQAIELEESIANRGRSVGDSLIVTSVRATQEALGSEQLRQQLRVRICMGLEDPKDADLVFGHGAARHGWDPQLLDAPGKFFLRARSQGLAVPKLARAFFVADELAHRLAATYAHQAAPLDAPSRQAADAYPPPPGTAPPTTPAATTPSPPPSPSPLGAGRHDPAARLLEVLATIGAQGARVLGLAERTGQPGPTVHAQLVALEAAGTVERAGKGRWRLTQPPTRP